MQKENEANEPVMARVISFRSAESDEEGAEDGLRAMIRSRLRRGAAFCHRRSQPLAVDNRFMDDSREPGFCLRRRRPIRSRRGRQHPTAVSVRIRRTRLELAAHPLPRHHGALMSALHRMRRILPAFNRSKGRFHCESQQDQDRDEFSRDSHSNEFSVAHMLLVSVIQVTFWWIPGFALRCSPGRPIHAEVAPERPNA